jgi:CO/xanthine dehydrogenase FAD-binding subunit
MIIEYHRPDTLESALELLQRETPLTVPLGGGSVLNQPSDSAVAVVDLQNLELNTIKKTSNTLNLGASVTLQQFLETPIILSALTKAIKHEATYNRRQVATLAGSLVACNGRSPLSAAFLALDAHIILLPGEERIGVGDLLPLRKKILKGRLITEISVPVNVKFAYEYVARSPADLPIVSVSATQWSNGRTRIVLGGYGPAPILALDGVQDQDQALTAIENAFFSAGDQWASTEYRVHTAKILAKRCLKTFKE